MALTQSILHGMFCKVRCQKGCWLKLEMIEHWKSIYLATQACIWLGLIPVNILANLVGIREIVICTPIFIPQ